jgi:hypothetical protein
MNHSELLKNPIGMSSRLRKAYVAASSGSLSGRESRARQSVAAAACSSGSLLPSHDAFGDLQNENADERELIPTGGGSR